MMQFIFYTQYVQKLSVASKEAEKQWAFFDSLQLYVYNTVVCRPSVRHGCIVAKR